MKAAGPTTSIREEPYQADVIQRYGVRAVIGKGGMGAKTLAALKECGAVYLNAIGGAAQYYARTVEEVLGVNLLEFGIPEAMWHLRVNGFRGDRDDGRARQQPARGCGEGDGRRTGGARNACSGAGFRSGLLQCELPSGQVAQLVERSPEKAGVGGSIPSLATTESTT